MNKTDRGLFKRAALDSLGTLAYIFLVGQIMTNGSKIFGQSDNKIVAPIFALLLFILSALVTGWLILGKPLTLYLDGEKKASLKLLFATGICLFILLLLAGATLFWLR